MYSLLPAGPYYLITRRGDEEPVMVCDTREHALEMLEMLEG